MAKKNGEKSAYEREIEQIQLKYDRQLENLKRQAQNSQRRSVRYAARGISMIAFGRRHSYDKERGRDYLRIAGQTDMEDRIVNTVEYQQIMFNRKQELEAAKQREIERRLIERQTERAVNEIDREDRQQPIDGGMARLVPEEREGAHGLSAKQQVEMMQLSQLAPANQNKEVARMLGAAQQQSLIAQADQSVTQAKGIGR
ncbi:MAG: hypothetical protein ACI3ZY_00070 [Parabacteroides sp.]